MKKGGECGMGFMDWTDFQVGDQIQAYEEKQEKRYLWYEFSLIGSYSNMWAQICLGYLTCCWNVWMDGYEHMDMSIWSTEKSCVMNEFMVVWGMGDRWMDVCGYLHWCGMYGWINGYQDHHTLWRYKWARISIMRIAYRRKEGVYQNQGYLVARYHITFVL